MPGRERRPRPSGSSSSTRRPRRWRPCGRQHPEDLSVAIAEALLALGTGDREADRAGAGPARRAGRQDPAGGPARGGAGELAAAAEAARQVPLWAGRPRLPEARPTRTRLRGAADKLAARAIEAARRQSDNTALMAMLRERGDLALARGDRPAAEAEWSRMLETVIEPPGRKARRRSRPGRRARRRARDDSARHVDGRRRAGPLRTGGPSSRSRPRRIERHPSPTTVESVSP